MQNIKHIQATDIPAEHYLHDQIRKTAGWLDGSQVIPSEGEGPPSQWVWGHWTEAIWGRVQIHEGGGNGDRNTLMWQDVRLYDGYQKVIPPAKQSSMTNPKREMTPHCISCSPVTKRPSMTDIGEKSPGCKMIRTKLVWAIHRPVRLGIDT